MTTTISGQLAAYNMAMHSDGTVRVRFGPRALTVPTRRVPLFRRLDTGNPVGWATITDRAPVDLHAVAALHPAYDDSLGTALREGLFPVWRPVLGAVAGSMTNGVYQVRAARIIGVSLDTLDWEDGSGRIDTIDGYSTSAAIATHATP